MKTFVITSAHDVFEGVYDEGQQDQHINGYELKETVKADNWEEAVNTFFKKIGFNLDIKNCEVEDNALQTSCLVDAYNLQPTDKEVEQWKEGKIKLYSNLITIWVHELVQVELV